MNSAAEAGKVMSQDRTADSDSMDHEYLFHCFGGEPGFKAVHQALSRALAEPAAQGENAHGARAGFLLAQIAPQIFALRQASLEEALRATPVPSDVLALVLPYLRECPAVNEAVS